ncbi:MAG TPA: sigma-70 family RNA polymerase sigma factor [Candidatus Polarisedimenticolia bacterium]|jgi:RNA polymerase sigma-70 factor (ECF subfamily)
MTEPTGSEGDLVRRMLAGDEPAFEEFFENHFSRVYRFALTRVGGRADVAEEITQATLCRAVSKLESYRGEAALFTWLCTICRHEISRHYRRSEIRHESLGLPEDSEDARVALDSLAAAIGEGPDAQLHRKEVARLVQVTLDNLPWSYASALEWKYLHEVPVKEIAERLELGLKAAESLLSRARAAFRDGFSTLTAERSRSGSPADGSRRAGAS